MKNLPRIIINKQRFDFTRTPVSLKNSEANNFPIFQARTLKFDMWAFWGIKKFSTTGFLKILIFGDFNPKKVIFEGRKMGEKGVNDKILKNPVVKIFFIPQKAHIQVISFWII